MAENITAHMDKSLESLKHNFSKVRTGRANANILSDITVDYYGVPTPVTHTIILSHDFKFCTIYPSIKMIHI